jgi:phospholipid/cholesterol/gamma-HCH transport system substrate-binding protein
MGMSTEKKVGLFFLLALIALGVMIELVQDWHPFQVQKNYKALFKSVVGLKIGDPVRMAGVEVGKVKSIAIDDSHVKIDFYVTGKTTLRTDTLAEVRRTNLLGGQFLGLTFGSERNPVLPPGSEVKTRESASIDQLIDHLDQNQQQVLGALGQLISQTREPLLDMVQEMKSVTDKIDRGKGTLGLLVNDPQLYNRMQTATVRLNTILGRIDKGEGTLGRLVKDPSLYDDAEATMANLKDLSSRVKEGKGTVGRLFADDTLYNNASDALVDIRKVADKVDRGTGTLGKLVNDDALYRQTLGTMTHANHIAAKIDEGHGTLGRLVNQDDIYRDAKTTLNKVEKTVDGLSDTGPLSALGVVVGTLF